MKYILAVLLTVLLGLSLVVPAIAQDVCEGATEVTIRIDKQFGLCWSANDDGITSGYNIYKDGALYTTVAHSTCSEICETPRLTPDSDGVFQFVVKAFNTTEENEVGSPPVTLTVLQKKPGTPGACVITTAGE